jgi:hypothetical protein
MQVPTLAWGVSSTTTKEISMKKELTHRYIMWALVGFAYVAAGLFFVIATPGPAVAQGTSTAAQYGARYLTLSDDERARVDKRFFIMFNDEVERNRKEIPGLSPDGSMLATKLEYDEVARTTNMHMKLTTIVEPLTPDALPLFTAHLNQSVCSVGMYAIFIIIYGGEMSYTYYNFDNSLLLTHTVGINQCIGDGV